VREELNHRARDTQSGRGAIWDHVFPFSPQPFDGVVYSDGKSATRYQLVIVEGVRRDAPPSPLGAMYHSAVAKSPGALVREFCKKHHICTHCFHRHALRGVTRCQHCKNRDRVAQRKRLRRKYQREKSEGVCVRCHKKRAQATNVRCVECQAYHSAHKKRKRADLKSLLNRASKGLARKRLL
jgi:hypothetical protein